VAAGLALVRFVGGGSPVGEVFVVDAAGEFHQLTGLGSSSALGASLPVWSPDGRQVAFGPPKPGSTDLDRLSAAEKAEQVPV
jgi:Tol biopolymer transport system component